MNSENELYDYCIENIHNLINGDLSILTDGEISPGKFVYNDFPSATPGLQDFFNDRNIYIF